MTKVCIICGGKVLHYENPNREVCLNEHSHARLLAAKRPGNVPPPEGGREAKKAKRNRGR